MTLIYAGADPDIAFMISDTLLTAEPRRDDPVRPMTHALKAHILDGSQAIAFAGRADMALDAIVEIGQARGSIPAIEIHDSLFRCCTKAAKESDRPEDEVEFISLHVELEEKKLFKVTKRGIEPCRRANIGDGEEYKRMMALRRIYTPPATQSVQQPDGSFQVLPLVESDGAIEFEEVQRAMRGLVFTRRHADPRRAPTVGTIAGGIVRIVDTGISKQLEYLQEVEVSVTPWEDHSGYTVLASNSGIRGVAIYYRKGLGFVFVAGSSNYCKKMHAKTLPEFIEAARTQCGLELVGGGWSE